MTEPTNCPICDKPFFVEICNGCGHIDNETETLNLFI